MRASGDISAAGPLARTYARAVVALRYLIIVGWAAATVALLRLPDVEPSAQGLEGFVPEGSAAVRTELASVDAFGFPLISRTVLVQRDPDGLSPYAQARAAVRAVALTQGRYPEAAPLIGGLPVTNTRLLFPSSSERDTTAVTYLFARPNATLTAQTRAARRLAEERLSPRDSYAGVTGSVPARVAQARILRDRLPLVEAATLTAIVSIVAAFFRSLTAPLVALVTAALAFFVALQSTGRVGAALGIAVPDELEPLILALVLGIVTDYAIFFLAAMRRHLTAGLERLDAARQAAASTGPIVAVAGLTVAAGTAVLVVADSAIFSAFGPALALAVSVAALVSLTLVPALLAVFGRLLYWPSRLDSQTRSWLGRGAAGGLTKKPVAAALVTACVVGLGALGTSVADLRLGVSFVPSLPERTETRTAAAAAAEGFAPGILSPTVLLVEGDGVSRQRRSLDRLGELLAQQPGVAGVVGPGDLLRPLERRVVLSRSGDAARFLVVLTDEPLGSRAVENLSAIADELPEIGAAAGLTAVRYGLGGDTALARELVQMTRQDLARIAIAALLVNFLLLALFLRALVAPVFLLAWSVLALAAALGAMSLVFQDGLGHDSITFYVPFASAVLLLSLGSDYNIFGVGYIWEKARRMPLPEAIGTAVPETSAAITVAGLALAASFGMLALVPLQPFRELAFVMAVGILLDALVVRSILMPSALTLLGPISGWPRRMLRRSAATGDHGADRRKEIPHGDA